MKPPLFCPVCDELVAEGTPTSDPANDGRSNPPQDSEPFESMVICPHCGSAIELVEMDPTAPSGTVHSDPQAVEEVLGSSTADLDTSDLDIGDSGSVAPQQEDIEPASMELEIDEPDASPDDSPGTSPDLIRDDGYSNESELETVRENFEDTELGSLPETGLDDSSSLHSPEEESQADASLDWSSVPIPSRPRRPERSWLMKLLPPILGGLTAIPIAIAILWYGFGKDIGGAGPKVARVIPWIVPKHLRGRPYYDPVLTPPSRREANPRPSARNRLPWPAPLDAPSREESGRQEPDRVRQSDEDEQPSSLPDALKEFPDAPETRSEPTVEGDHSASPAPEPPQPDSEPPTKADSSEPNPPKQPGDSEERADPNARVREGF